MLAKKIQGAGGFSSTPAPTYIEDVFSTWLYTGSGANRTITNGIDLAGNGGLVWMKNRSGQAEHALYDTERGATFDLSSSSTAAQTTQSTGLTAFNSDGFSLGTLSKLNANSSNFASWTFRQQPKFFDVVTYTGTGTSVRSISHSLGVKPGMILVKKTNATSNWSVWHNYGSSSTAAWSPALFLNSTAAKGAGAVSFGAPTDSTFPVGIFTGQIDINANGATYIAYLFAHDTSSDGLIQCGAYTGNGSATGPTVTLGWEPQWLLIKNSGGTGSWNIIDDMRGMPVGSADSTLLANTTAIEGSSDYVSPTPTGFQITSTSTEVNTNASQYIYVAIRRGPMKVPTTGSGVFAPTARVVSQGVVTTGFPVDMLMSCYRSTSTGFYATSRLQRGGNSLVLSSTAGETTTTPHAELFASNTGYLPDGVLNDWFFSSGSSVTDIDYAFRRAPNFFDMVCYTGTGVARTVTHNLGVAPELMIVKSRGTVVAYNWLVYSAGLGATKGTLLNTNGTPTVSTTYWNDTAPTSSVFSLGTNNTINATTVNYVAYLFATCPGVSKVGSYTGNGTVQTIDCGFSAGARFVMIKRTDTTGDWYVWDTARGIIAANDPHLSLNTTGVEVTTNDSVDPTSSGFIVNQVAATNINASGATYIYLAIA